MKSILVFFAFFLVATANEAQVQFGRNDYTKKLHFNGNIISFSKPITPHTTGLHVHAIPQATKLNGEAIYSTTFSTKIKPANYTGGTLLESDLFNALKNTLIKLPDGCFAIFFYNFVVDKNGKLAYFDFSKIERMSKNTTVSTQTITTPKKDEESLIVALEKMIKDAQKGDKDKKTITPLDSIPGYSQYENQIYRELYTILSKPQIKFTPAHDGNKFVNSYFFVYPLFFEIANGKVKLMDITLTLAASR